MKHTIFIFKHLHRNLPPLFPEATKREMADVFERFEENPTTLDDLEEQMLKFGYEIWPWNNAYREFFASCKQRMGGHFLSSKSELAINEALTAIHRELRDFTDQEVVSTEKGKYLNRVSELKQTIESVKKTLDHLRSVADTETEHPALADEIRSKVRGFEHSLCELGLKFNHHEVENAAEFFRGRRDELNRLRGINHSVEINFEG